MISIVFHLDVTSYPHHKMWGGGAIMDSLCCVLPWVCASPLMCPLYKSYTNWRIFFKLGWNVHLNKGMCKTMLPMCRLKVKVTIEGQISNNQMLDIMLCPLCKSLSNLVNMLVGITSRPSCITSQIPPGTPELWPANCPKLGFTLYKSKSCHPVFIKLGEYVGGHNISTKFYNQPSPPDTPELWPLNCPK